MCKKFRNCHRYRMKFALRRREGELTALLSTAVSTGPIYPRLGNYVYPQTHPKCKCWGCIGKFRIFATTWALRFSKLKKKWLRKWSLKLPTPLQKSAEFTAHIMHSFDDPLHFHDLQWKQILFHTLVEGKVKVVLYPWPDVSSSRTIMPSWMVERINQCILRAVNSANFLRGGWQL